MSSPAEAREQVGTLLREIAGVKKGDIRDTASLKQLGVDSLGSVELAEGLERTFDITPADYEVAEWRTVGDVVRTVTRPRTASTSDGTDQLASRARPDTEGTGITRLGLALAVVGGLVGVGLGVLIAAILASGLSGGSMPESQREAAPTPAATENRFGTVTTAPAPPPASASLSITPSTVKPGERFTLSGAITAAAVGETLTIQMRDANGQWQDFPVAVHAADGGSFTVELYTGQPGPHEFRVNSPSAHKSTPTASMTIEGKNG